MTKWFITGGEGFIGYHICKKILANRRNDEIVTYDAHKHFLPLEESNWTYYQKHRIDMMDNIIDPRDKLKRVHGDVTNRGRLKEHLEKHTPDIIIHLAALPIANVSNEYPTEARRNIFDTTVTLMDVIRELSYDINRIVYTSSSMVYGDFNKENGEVIPAKETDNLAPLGIYGAMKTAGEHVVRAYSHRFNIPHSIIRPSAVYGSTDCNKRVVEIFMNRAMQNKPLRLDNGGYHKLDFSYVKDVAKGFILASTHDNAINETFNITRGEGRSIRELAEVISNIVHKDVETYEEEKDVYRPNRGALDISKAKELINYNPKYSLEKGIDRYYYFIHHKHENN